MIDYDPKGWLSIFFRLRGSVLPRLLPRVLVAALIGLGAAWLNHEYALKVPGAVHTMIGLALGLLLVFRTNASYDRWWEGRKLLGAMVNRTRDLTRQVIAYVDGEDADSVAERSELRRMIGAWYALTCQSVRFERDLSIVKQLSDAERTALEGITNRAPVMLLWISTHLAQLARAGKLTEQRLQLMDQNVTALLDSLGACERIAKTPVPFAYAQHIKVFVVLFCYTAPLTFAHDMRWYTPLGAAILAFALLGVDEIGVEIEDPFGYDANDLPLEKIGEGIDRATADLVTARPLTPAATTPTDDTLRAAN